MSALINIFDTETSGIPNWNIPSDDPSQPHLVEIAALLCNEQGAVIDSYKAIIKPEGWEFDPEAAAKHGITHEMAMDVGIPEIEALEGFLAIHARADLRVAHSINFDDRIIRIALKRYHGAVIADAYKVSGEKYCTCINSRAPVGLKKPPTLAEAYKHFTGEDLLEAHRAMPDAQACARVYFALQGVAMPPRPEAAISQ